MNQPLPQSEARLHMIRSITASRNSAREACFTSAFTPAFQTGRPSDSEGYRSAGDVCLALVLLQGLTSFAYLSVFGFQPELCPARGFQAAGLGVDLDAFWSLHHQRARRRLQSVTERGVTEPGGLNIHTSSQAVVLHSPLHGTLGPRWV